MPDIKSETQKQSSGEVLVDLLKISHEDLPEDILLAINTEDVVHNSDTYKAAYIELKEPKQGEKVPTCEIGVSNIDLQTMDLIQDISDEPEVLLTQVYASTPNTVERTIGKFKIKNVTGNLKVCSFELSFSGLSNKGVPKKKFTARDFPGLFS